MFTLNVLQGAIQKLLTAAKGLEAGYVMRALQASQRLHQTRYLLAGSEPRGWSVGWSVPCRHQVDLFDPQSCIPLLQGKLRAGRAEQTALVALAHAAPAAPAFQPRLSFLAPQGKLRIGLAEQTVLVALAHAAALEKDGGAKGSSEAVAGRLEQAAQIVKQVGQFSGSTAFVQWGSSVVVRHLGSGAVEWWLCIRLGMLAARRRLEQASVAGCGACGG